MQEPPAPPPPPPPPPIDPGAAPGRVTVRIEGAGGLTAAEITRDPRAVYEAALAQRRELREQLERLGDQREELAQELAGSGAASPSAGGLQARIAELDRRITDVERQLGESEGLVARLAGIPGAIVDEPPIVDQGPPEWALAMSFVFMFVVVFPLVIAFARRIWRKGAAPTALALPPEWSERMGRLEQAVDAIAIEVERVTEGQRFVTKLMTEGNREQGAALPRGSTRREG